jgi:microcystin-dependent protein
MCNGQLIPITQNETLFNLIGTTYGGDGTTTFGLPDLRGRRPVHQGTGAGLSPYVIGQAGGTESVTLTTAEIPAHGHVPQAVGEGGTVATPTGGVWAQWSNNPYAATAGTPVPMATQAIASAGGGGAHENRPPFLVVSFIISLFGVFPSRN